MSVENFVKFIRRWKMFVNLLKEPLSDVCFYIFAVGWIVPYSVALSVSSLCSVAIAVVFVACGLLVG